jgi:hypothetical protein
MPASIAIEPTVRASSRKDDDLDALLAEKATVSRLRSQLLGEHARPSVLSVEGPHRDPPGRRRCDRSRRRGGRLLFVAAAAASPSGKISGAPST